MTKIQLIKSEGNCVDILVWKPSEENASVGHAVLRTSQFYVSFWPDRPAMGVGVSLREHLQGRPGIMVQDLTRDKINETSSITQDQMEEYYEKSEDKRKLSSVETPPDVVVSLYSLDVKKLNEAIQRIQSNKLKWAVTGGSFIGKKNTHNCSSLVAYLLYEAGINKLYSPLARRGGSITSFAVGSVFTATSTTFLVNSIIKYGYTNTKPTEKEMDYFNFFSCGAAMALGVANLSLKRGIKSFFLMSSLQVLLRYFYKKSSSCNTLGDFLVGAYGGVVSLAGLTLGSFFGGLADGANDGMILRKTGNIANAIYIENTVSKRALYLLAGASVPVSMLTNGFCSIFGFHNAVRDLFLITPDHIAHIALAAERNEGLLYDLVDSNEINESSSPFGFSASS